MERERRGRHRLYWWPCRRMTSSTFVKLTLNFSCQTHLEFLGDILWLVATRHNSTINSSGPPIRKRGLLDSLSFSSMVFPPQGPSLVKGKGLEQVKCVSALDIGSLGPSRRHPWSCDYSDG